MRRETASFTMLLFDYCACACFGTFPSLDMLKIYQCGLNNISDSLNQAIFPPYKRPVLAICQVVILESILPSTAHHTTIATLFHSSPNKARGI